MSNNKGRGVTTKYFGRTTTGTGEKGWDRNIDCGRFPETHKLTLDPLPVLVRRLTPHIRHQVITKRRYKSHFFSKILLL